MIPEIVTDSGVAVKWYVTEEYSDVALRIFHDYQTGLMDLLAPDLIYAEFDNIVWKKRVFQGLPQEEALAAVTAFHDLSFKITPAADLLDDA